MKLNAEQEAAVRFCDGPALVLAGPGSGKTAVITSRTHQLITESKVPAGNILVVTFSRKAAESMKDRFLKLQKTKAVPWFGTFHSLFFLILREAYGLNADSIIREEQKIAFLREETEKHGLFSEDSEEFFENLLNGISCIKSGSCAIEAYRPDSVAPEIFRSVYTGYCRSLSSAGLIDFDDMLTLCLSLLQERNDILSYWQKRFRYILIDEFQDINPIQYEIIRMLSLPENNLFVVGDDDQSIYSFRGARPAIMKQFLKDFPQARRIALNRNYRCHPRIQRASLKMISENRNRFQKNLKSAVPSSSEGSFRILKFPDRQSEYAGLADHIRRRLADGTSPDEIAILVRSGQNIPLLSHMLKDRRIPTGRTAPSRDLFRNFIAEDFAAYLRLAGALTSEAPDREQFQKDFFRIINRPSRYITRTALEQAFLSGAVCSNEVLAFLYSYYRKRSDRIREIRKLQETLRMLRKSAPYAAFKYFRSAAGYDSYLPERALQYQKDPEEYLRLIEEMEQALADGAAFPPENGQAAAAKNAEPDREGPHVHLLTMHAAKGLEFSHVYLPDLNEDLLPVKQAKTPAQIEEERRVFYVAMTRASVSLEVYFCERIHRKKAVPSRFLNCFLKQ